MSRDILGELGINQPNTPDNGQTFSQMMEGFGGKAYANDEALQTIEQNPMLAKLAIGLTEYPNLQSLVNKAGGSDAVKMFNQAIEASGLPAWGAGHLEGLGNSYISAANLIPQMLGYEERVPHLNLTGMLPDTFMNNIMGKTGNVTGALSAILPGAGKLSQLLPRVEGYKKFVTHGLIPGVTSGYVFGENEEGDRGLSSILSGILNTAGMFTKSGITKTIKEDTKAAQRKYNKLYDSLFEKAEREGLNEHVKVPFLRNKKILEGIDKKYLTHYEDALKHPSLHNVHEARKSLSDFIRNKEDILAKGGSINDRALTNAKRLEEALENTLNRTFAKSKTGLNELYSNIKLGYKNEVIPLTSVPAIKKLTKKGLVPKDFMRKITGNTTSGEMFRENLALNYPEVGINQALTSISPKDLVKYFALPAVGVGAGGWAGRHYGLFGGNE